jgi:hypothetical protein
LLNVPNLLQGSSPTFDAQAIPDETDWQILAAGHNGYGTCGVDQVLVAPAVTPCTQTCTNTNLTALSTLTGSATLTVSSTAGFPPAGYFTCSTTGGGTATIGYTGGGGSGSSFTGCFYISGGSGSIAAAATLTSICAVSIAAGAIFNNFAVVSVTAQAISIVNQSGTAYQVLPASAGDRKDTLVFSSSGTPAIEAGTPCSQAGVTRSNMSFTNPPPVKTLYSTYSSSNPIVLTEIYVQATGQSGANTIVTGNLVDKSVPISPAVMISYGGAAADVALTVASTVYTVLTTNSLAVGTWLITGAVIFEKTSTGTAEVELSVTAGTASVFFGELGQTAAEGTVATTSETVTLPFSILVSVIAAGTILIQARANATGVTSKKNTVVSSLAGSGYSAIRVAASI